MDVREGGHGIHYPTLLGRNPAPRVGSTEIDNSCDNSGAEVTYPDAGRQASGREPLHVVKECRLELLWDPSQGESDDLPYDACHLHGFDQERSTRTVGG